MSRKPLRTSVYFSTVQPASPIKHSPARCPSLCVSCASHKICRSSRASCTTQFSKILSLSNFSGCHKPPDRTSLGRSRTVCRYGACTCVKETFMVYVPFWKSPIWSGNTVSSHRNRKNQHCHASIFGHLDNYASYCIVAQTGCYMKTTTVSRCNTIITRR
jgi:hypothetical protein